MKPKTIMIDGVEYVRSTDLKAPAEKLDGLKYVIIRSKDAGCFSGYLVEKKDRNVKLRKARRLWYWDGAASLSQLAMEGVKKPDNCKFPCEVDNVEIDDVCEVIDATAKAQESINSVQVWKQ
jgi:hypothetical protein